MEKGKKPSFLFDLFMKYKENTHDAGEADAKEEPKAEQLLQEASGDDHEQAAEPEVKAPELSPIDEKVKTLYSYYSLIYKVEIGGGGISNLTDFSKRALSSIVEWPDYYDYESEVMNFIDELGRDASAKSQAYRQLQMTYTNQKEQHAKAEEGLRSARTSLEALKQAGAEEGSILAAEQKEREAENKLTLSPLPDRLPPVDASICIKAAKNNLCAFLFVFPPCQGGASISEDSIISALKEKHIVYGVHERAIKELVVKEGYMQIYLAAEGVAPIPGKDGEVIDKVARTSEIAIQQDEKGKADYKNLNLIKNVITGDVLCEIRQPVEGTPGMSVTGAVIDAPNGKAPKIPNGKNTILSSDMTRLMAGVDGYVKFRNGLFDVEQIYVVKGNVDYGVGNIDFAGDVVVNGDVLNGFSIKAKGSVSVQGMVEDAQIIAEGDIIINKGMNGNRHGLLDARGTVKAGFLENCTVYSGEDIRTNSIISCEIFCEDTVYVEGTRGVIIGGTITALRSVEARIIGSKSSRETEIVLGEMPRLVTRRQEAQAELKDTDSILDKLGKNVTYLESIKSTLPPDKLQILDQLRQQLSLYEEKKRDLTITLERLDNSAVDFSQCRVKANMIFPPTKIQIGTDSYVMTTVTAKCHIFKGEEGIVMGTL